MEGGQAAGGTMGRQKVAGCGTYFQILSLYPGSPGLFGFVPPNEVVQIQETPLGLQWLFPG